MSDIKLEHEEANILCTIVLLKGMVGAGVIPTPLSVELDPLSNEGWRRVAIEHLEAARHKPKKGRPKKAVDYEELNAEFDYYERRSH